MIKHEQTKITNIAHYNNIIALLYMSKSNINYDDFFFT